MDVQAEKIELASLILDTNDPVILKRIRAVFCDVDYNYDELPDHVKKSINAGLKDIQKERVRNHEDVMREFKLQYKSDYSRQVVTLSTAEMQLKKMKWTNYRGRHGQICLNLRLVER